MTDIFNCQTELATSIIHTSAAAAGTLMGATAPKAIVGASGKFSFLFKTEFNSETSINVNFVISFTRLSIFGETSNESSFLGTGIASADC